jgi:hypothetical protein
MYRVFPYVFPYVALHQYRCRLCGVQRLLKQSITKYQTHNKVCSWHVHCLWTAEHCAVGAQQQHRLRAAANSCAHDSTVASKPSRQRRGVKLRAHLRPECTVACPTAVSKTYIYIKGSNCISRCNDCEPRLKARVVLCARGFFCRWVLRQRGI